MLDHTSSFLFPAMPSGRSYSLEKLHHTFESQGPHLNNSYKYSLYLLELCEVYIVNICSLPGKMPESYKVFSKWYSFLTSPGSIVEELG